MAKHDNGGGIISYDSFEEMQADQRRAHEAALKNMTASQRAIPLGGYACNLSNLRDLGPIFGVIQSAEEVRAWHELYCRVGDLAAARAVLAQRGEFDPPSRWPKVGTDLVEVWQEDGFDTAQEFIDYYVAQHVGSWTDGYLFGTWLSNLCPEGELGSAHASVCVPISAEVYADAKAHGGYVHTNSAAEIAEAMRVVAVEQKAREGATEGEGNDDQDNSER